MRDIQTLVEAAFDAPGCPVELQPLGGIQRSRLEAGDQRDRFGGVFSKVPAQERDLFDAGKIHRFSGGCLTTQYSQFGQSLVELTFAGQVRSGLARGKNPLEERARVFRWWLAAWAGCL